VTIHKPLGSVAKSYLFVPANRLDRAKKALTTAADVVIVDLEDAVLPQDKDQARQDLARFVPSRNMYVRINGATTSHFQEDMAMLAEVPWLGGVALPKVSSPEDIEHTVRLLVTPVPVLGLIETAQGLVTCEEIALSGASRLAFGGADFAADLGTPPSEVLFAYPRARLVIASALAGLPAPVDGPTMVFKDEQQLTRDASVARSLGMGGKLCIHPSQVPEINALFGHSAAEEQWARGILEASEEGGVSVVNGEMVDAPVLARARGILGR
jgi:citrate lyase subunit beta / citryl-CoA lyase